MRAGLLRNRVTFQKLVAVRNEYGEDVSEWHDLAPDEMVQIIPISGDERYQSDHLDTVVGHKIRMRYRRGIDNTMRILFGDRIFDIDAVINVHEKDRELHIMCTEVSF
jgi:SPP1 family predicted phage head-tail adaptor